MSGHPTIKTVDGIVYQFRQNAEYVYYETDVGETTYCVLQHRLCHHWVIFTIGERGELTPLNTVVKSSDGRETVDAGPLYVEHEKSIDNWLSDLAMYIIGQSA